MSNISYHKLSTADTSLIELIADWYFTEWTIDKATTINRFSAFPDDGIPFQLVMKLNGVPIATGGIYDHVGLLDALPRLKPLQPWLALVYTIPEQRKKGYGALLCQEIQTLTKRIGINEMFLFTHTAEPLYKRLGWEQLERVYLKDKDIAVMKKDL
jgi:GNAT superfamily N-acetyltransferase